MPPAGLATAYKVYRAPTGGSKSVISTTLPPTLSSFDPEPEAGVQYTYTVTAINSAGVEGPPSAPLDVAVSQPTDSRDQTPSARGVDLRVYPNPFNPSATISFRLAQKGVVELGLYDVRGRQVATLVQGTLPAGEHRVPLARGAGQHSLASGVYFVRLRADGRDTRMKAVLVQ